MKPSTTWTDTHRRLEVLLRSIGDDINCPGETLGADSVGATRLVMNCSYPKWEAYEWGEWREIEPADMPDVVIALCEYIQWLTANEKEARPYTDLGRNVASLLPGVLKT